MWGKQLYHAPHYANQHLSDGELDIKVNKTSHYNISGKFSQVIRQRKYFLLIKINQDNLQDPVGGWYCKGKAGARTVGCCAHVATINWYMGKGKH